MRWLRTLPRLELLLPAFSCCLLLGCSAKGELDRLCEVATEVMDDAAVSPEHKASTIAKRFAPRNLKVKDALERVANAPAGERMPILREVGGESWACPAFERALDPEIAEVDEATEADTPEG